ncbi:hypothetical protein [Roseivivax sp. CAU 1761]
MQRASSAENQDNGMAEILSVRDTMQDALAKYEEKISDLLIRLEQLTEQGEDFQHSQHRGRAESQLHLAEDRLRKARTCAKLPSRPNLMNGRRHKFDISRRVKVARSALDAFEEEITPSTGLTM